MKQDRRDELFGCDGARILHGLEQDFSQSVGKSQTKAGILKYHMLLFDMKTRMMQFARGPAHESAGWFFTGNDKPS